MDDDKIDLLLASADAELSDLVRPHIDRDAFNLVEVSNANDALPLLASMTTRRALLMISEAPPGSHVLQQIVDLGEAAKAAAVCATNYLDRRAVTALLAIGIQDVIPIQDLSPQRLRDVIFASFTRDIRRRELVRSRERALLKRDIVAAVAAASTRREIFGVFLDGLLALGARGAACWSLEGDSLALAAEVGDVSVTGGAQDLPLEAPHPGSECARLTLAAWYVQAHQLKERFAAFECEHRGSLGFVPLLDDGSVVAVIVVAHDELPIEEETHALEQLCAQVGEALRRSTLQSELQDDRDSDRRLLGIISHDLRNPLHTVMLAASQLAHRLQGPDAEMVKRISRAARVATRLTHDLLTFTKVSADGLELTLQSTNVFDVLISAVEDAKLRAVASREIVLEMGPGSDEGEALIDAGRIEQAVGNLLSNALTYSPPAGLIRVRASSNGHAVYVDIENRGARIDPASVARMFEPLTRLSSLAERGSMGLGLFIVDRIMEAHGGRVWVEPAEPDGVRVCLQLPRSSAAQGEHTAVKIRSESSRPFRPPPPPPEDPTLQRLSELLKGPELRDPLAMWAAARGTAQLPHPLAMERSRLLGYLPDMVSARVTLDQFGEPVFVWMQMGPRLERQLRGTLHGKALTADAGGDLGSQYGAYHRCWSKRQPVYDYARQRGVGGVSFQRLLLPLSHDSGKSVTEILGIVLFR